MTQELGAPLKVSEEVHYNIGHEHFSKAAETLKSYTFTKDCGGHTIIKEARKVKKGKWMTVFLFWGSTSEDVTNRNKK